MKERLSISDVSNLISRGSSVELTIHYTLVYAIRLRFIYFKTSARAHTPLVIYAMIKCIWLLFSTLYIQDTGASDKWCKADLCRGQHVLCDDNGVSG